MQNFQLQPIYIVNQSQENAPASLQASEYVFLDSIQLNFPSIDAPLVSQITLTLFDLKSTEILPINSINFGALISGTPLDYAFNNNNTIYIKQWCRRFDISNKVVGIPCNLTVFLGKQQ